MYARFTSAGSWPLHSLGCFFASLLDPPLGTWQHVPISRCAHSFSRRWPVSLEGLSIFERGTLPRWVKVRQQLNSVEVSDVAAATAAEFQRAEIKGAITPGMKV